MIDANTYNSKTFIIVEFVFLFLALPLILFFLTPIPVLPFLWVVAIWCFFILKKEAKLPKKKFTSFKGLNKVFLTVFIQFVIITFILFAFIYFFMPDKVFSLIKENPLFWLVIMIIYPTLSVYPQELVYRVYFFYRYEQFFKNRNIFIYLNAFLFGYMHILFHNWIAVLLTIGGGFIFARLYEKTHSLMVLFVAHSLYGCMLFTIGLGEYFYTGTVMTVSETFKF